MNPCKSESDLVWLGNFIGDKPDFSCACLVGLQYGHTIILLLVMFARNHACFHPSWHRECPFTGFTFSSINQQKLTKYLILTHHSNVRYLSKISAGSMTINVNIITWASNNGLKHVFWKGKYSKSWKISFFSSYLALHHSLLSLLFAYNAGL